MALGAGVGEAHEDEEPAVGVAESRAPPLAAVEDDLVALDDGGGGHGGGVGGGDGRLGHAERGTDLPGEQRCEPAGALLGGAVVEQDLGVAGVGGVAVEHLGRERRVAHLLGERGVFGGGEPGSVRRVGQVEVPQPGLPGPGLQLAGHGRDGPRARLCARGGQMRPVRGLGGEDLPFEEVAHGGEVVACPGGVCEVHDGPLVRCPVRARGG